jgi:phenylalanyl-tRNA synthetase beta chain
MKFTLGWLKAHLETDASLQQITDKLTALGLELEGVEDRAKALAPFTVAYVVEAKPHPDADRLRVCVVDTGAEKVQVVCGAPNARTGMKGVFARAGLTIPGTGLLLKSGNIRGQASNGMLVSEREMGLSDEHDGIIDLPDDAPIGAPFAAVLGIDDPVIDVSITPNRADCLGVRGIARDLAAAGLGRLKPRAVDSVPGRFKSPIGVRIATDGLDPAPCPMFVGRYVRGVKNGASPAWLQNRLRAIGLRPISALVDITNFLTFDVGRPLHVFDAKKVKGDITVRLAQPGEHLLALNGKVYELDGGETAITDDAGPEALGGIIGGEHSGCTEATTDVFVEAALFDPLRTAITGRKHQIISDARYRFERGVDPEAVVEGMEAGTHMILDLCGGEASELVIAGSKPQWQRSYKLRPERIFALGGLEAEKEEAVEILTRLGFAVSPSGDALTVAPPSWRNDIIGEADLVEEVARVAGFDRIKPAPLDRLTALPTPAISSIQRRTRDARRALAGLGLVEAVTFSFIARADAELFGFSQPGLVLANPIAAELDAMRPSLLPMLIRAAQRNADRGFGDAALFEVGPIYLDDTPEGQLQVASAVRAGGSPRHWAQAARPVDAIDAKGDVVALLSALGLTVENLQIATEAPSWYHPGRSGVVKLGPKTVVAQFGELHPAVLKALEVKGPVVGCEVFLDRLPLPKAKASKARPLVKLSAFQPVERDFAFVLDQGVAADAVIRATKSVDRALIAGVSVFDLYQGKGVPEGKKSLAITVRLQPSDRTLTDEDIEAVSQKIVAAVTKATGASLRT